MGEEDVKRWAEVAVRVVNASFPEHSDDVVTWPVCCASITARISRIIYMPMKFSLPQTETARLLNQIGLYSVCPRRICTGKENV